MRNFLTAFAHAKWQLNKSEIKGNDPTKTPFNNKFICMCLLYMILRNIKHYEGVRVGGNNKRERIKQVGTLKYLGFTITSDTRCDKEMKKRIALSKDTFPKMKSIFTNRNIRIYTKINTLKTYIWSILLHGCECWTLAKDLERRLEAAEMWFIRRIMRISWTEKKSNDEVMEMAGYKRSLLKTIRKRQLQFLGI